MIKIDFEINQDGWMYRDALYLPENHSLTQDGINAMQMERFNNWLAIVQSASEAPADG